MLLFTYAVRRCFANNPFLALFAAYAE